MEYHKLNQVVAPIIAVVPDMVFLLEQINMESGPWYVTTDLVNIYFFILLKKDNQKQLKVPWDGKQYRCMVLPCLSLLFSLPLLLVLSLWRILTNTPSDYLLMREGKLTWPWAKTIHTYSFLFHASLYTQESC